MHHVLSQPVNSCAVYMGAPGIRLFFIFPLYCAASNQVDIFTSDSPNTTQSIVAILQLHMSSPSLVVIARAMASLMAMSSSDSNLNLVLSAHLDTLAICPPTKQAIIPALLGIAKFGDVHA